jgi:Uma2 family endonuclease
VKARFAPHEEDAMRIVAAEAPPGLLEHRRKFGHDRYDEMWEGVLHMNAVPHGDHQELAIQLGSWLLNHWRRKGETAVFPDRNVATPGGWTSNYRIPDLVLTTEERKVFDKGTHIEGPPLLCIEIHSPHDEAYEKLEFYAALGVPEVWVIDRDTKAVKVFALDPLHRLYIATVAGKDGWISSHATGIELRQAGGERLAIRMAGQPKTAAELPD